MRELSRTEYAIITHEGGFVRVRRTAKPMPVQLNRALDDLIDAFRMAVPLRERKNMGLLLDTRDAPIFSSEESVEAMRPVMSELFVGFSRVAILVQTALGKLQASRRSREESEDGRRSTTVFLEEDAAIAFLLGHSASTGPMSRR